MAFFLDDGEENVTDDGGCDNGGDEISACGNAMRFFKEPASDGTADDGTNGKSCFMDGHAQRAIGASRDAVEHAVRISMCTENAGYGDEHDDGDGA